MLRRAEDEPSPTLLVAASLLFHPTAGCAWHDGSDGRDRAVSLLDRALARAATTRERQLVAIGSAHLEADDDRLDALVRDHLADHPDNLLAAWIAAQHVHADHIHTCPRGAPMPDLTARPHPSHRPPRRPDAPRRWMADVRRASRSAASPPRLSSARSTAWPPR